MLTRTVTMSAALLVLCACDATMAPRDSAPARGDETRERIEAALEQASTSSPRAEVARPQRPEPLTPAPESPPEERFNLNSEDTPAQSFFMALVDQTQHNIVVHPDVSGSVSLMLQDVTVEEVLELVSEVYGYNYRSSPAGYIIFPATLQSRIFQIDYLNLQRSGMSRTRVSSGQVSEARGSSRRNNVGGAGGQVFSQSDRSSQDMQQISGSGIETSYEADFWTELEDTLEQMIGDVEGQQVVVNSQTGVIVVTALPDKLRSIGEYLDAIQDIAQRQVILEAKIVEVQLSDGFRSGINWVAVSQPGNDTHTFGQLAPPPGFTGDPSTLGGAPVTVQPGNPVTGFETSTLGGAFTMAFDIGDFNAFLELLEQQGETRVLSSPRVSTLNNQKAVIKAGTDEFFVTDIASNTVTGTASTTSRDVELTPFFSGIALDVTPQISADGEVTLHIHPTVSEVSISRRI